MKKNQKKIAYITSCLAIVIAVVGTIIYNLNRTYALDTSSGACLNMTNSLLKSIETGETKLTYECFGAKGDGKTDDAEAIKKTHEFANNEYANKGLFITVYGTKGKTYYISTGSKSSKSITIKIATDTDWQGANFIIDDYKDENKDGINDIDITKSLFEVISPMKVRTNTNGLVFKIQSSEFLKKIKTIKATDNVSFQVKGLKDLILNYHSGFNTQKRFFTSSSKWAIMVSSPEKIYIRSGINGNDGQIKYEMMIFDTKTESIEGGVIYDLSNTSRVEIFPIPEKKVTIKNGNFTTYTNNQVYTPKGERTSYTIRNIKILYTGNVEISGVNHYLNESKYKNIVATKYQKNKEGNQYIGFIQPDHSAYVTISKSNFQPHQYAQKYNTEHTNIGTYDISFSSSEYILYDRIGYSCNLTNNTTCYNKYILNSDNNRWGIMESSRNNKNVFITNSTLEHIDSHTGIYNLYVSNSTIGNWGFSVIGNGRLFVNSVKFDHSDKIINLKNDYGSNWNGEVILNNIEYIQNKATNPIIQYNNTGQNDYGYLSTFPTLYINNFKIDSTKTGTKSNYLNIIRNIRNEALKKPKSNNTAYYFKENMYIKNIKYSKGSGKINVFDSNFASTKNKSNLYINNYGGNKVTNIYVSSDSTVGRANTKEANNNLLMGNKINTKFAIRLGSNIDTIMTNKIKDTTNYFNKLKEEATFKSTKTTAELTPLITELKLSSGSLNETFNSNQLNYTANINASSVKINLKTSDNTTAIYLNGAKIDTNKGLSLNYGENNYQIKVVGTYGTIKTYTLKITRAYNFSVNVDGYQYNSEKNYLYTSNDTKAQTITKKIGESNTVISNNYLIKKDSKNKEIFRVRIINYSSKYSIADKEIYLSSEVAYETLKSKFTLNGVTLKVMDENGTEITSGNILSSYQIKIYYENILLDTLNIKGETVEYDNIAMVELDKVILVNSKMHFDDLKTKIRLNSIERIKLKRRHPDTTIQNLCTSDTIQIETTNKVINYMIAFLGDINGDGEVNRDDLRAIRNINKKETNEVFYAADVTEDGQVAINDIDKLDYMTK